MGGKFVVVSALSSSRNFGVLLLADFSLVVVLFVGVIFLLLLPYNSAVI